MSPFCSKTTNKHLLRLNQNVQIKKLKINSIHYQIFHLSLNIEINTCPVTISLLKNPLNRKIIYFY